MKAPYLSHKYYSLIGITLFSGCGGLLFYYVSISRAQARIEWEKIRQSNSKIKQGEPIGEHNRGTSNALVLEKMIDDAKTKSFREKIEAGYDAAVRTHNIGFPSSISESNGVKDEDNNSGR